MPQFRVPWAVHERLWPLKYLIFLGLLGYSVYSLAGAEQLAEVEPFKTAIVLRFIREWPFVVFALALLVAGLFIERFYCRYLCPLGAALAIPGKLAMFNWLKRYRNCGDPCHLCAQDCMVQAITPLGDINPNECLHCLNCQVKYFDASVCPVMILKQAKTDKKTDKPSPARNRVTAGSCQRSSTGDRDVSGRTRDIETEPSTNLNLQAKENRLWTRPKNEASHVGTCSAEPPSQSAPVHSRQTDRLYQDSQRRHGRFQCRPG